jgi:regulatory protein
MKEIDEDVYLKTLHSLAEKKYALLKDDQYLVRKKKVADYLMQKGYEYNLVQQVLAELTEK